MLEAAVEDAAREVVDAALAVHRALGPGLLESVYEDCLCKELRSRGRRVDRQVVVPVVYNGEELETGLRLDLLVDGCLIVEVKAVERLIPLHRSQALTYLKLSGHRLALLLNFNVPLIRDGIFRVIL